MMLVSLALAFEHSFYLEGMSVLELGTGCGPVAITGGMLGILFPLQPFLQHVSILSSCVRGYCFVDYPRGTGHRNGRRVDPAIHKKER